MTNEGSFQPRPQPKPRELTESMGSRENVQFLIEHLDEYLDSLPAFSGDLSGAKDIVSSEPGLYRLEEAFPVGVLYDSIIYESDFEIAVIAVNGKWLLAISEKGQAEIDLPAEIRELDFESLFSFDLHSHPGNDIQSGLPSKEDLYNLDSTINGYSYIATESGLLKIKKPESMPGGYSNLNDLLRAWSHWILKDLKLNSEQYDNKGAWNLWKEFCEKFFGLRTIPWENREEIENIFKEAENTSDKGKPS